MADETTIEAVAETAVAEVRAEQAAAAAESAVVAAEAAMTLANVAAAQVAHDAQTQLASTEAELQRHEESDQWLRSELESLRSMNSTLSSQVESLSIRLASLETPPAEVLPETTLEPVSVEETRMEAHDESQDESPVVAVPPKRRYQVV